MAQTRIFKPGVIVSTFTGQAGIVLTQKALAKAREIYRQGSRPGRYFAPGCCQNPDYVTQVPVLFEDRAFDIMRAMNIRKGTTVPEEKQKLLKAMADGLE